MELQTWWLIGGIVTFLVGATLHDEDEDIPVMGISAMLCLFAWPIFVLVAFGVFLRSVKTGFQKRVNK